MDEEALDLNELARRAPVGRSWWVKVETRESGLRPERVLYVGVEDRMVFMGMRDGSKPATNGWHWLEPVFAARWGDVVDGMSYFGDMVRRPKTLADIL